MRFILFFIIVLSAFVSCGEDKGNTNETDKCENVICDEWKRCSKLTGKCMLKTERCISNSDCDEGKECNTNHYCIGIHFITTWKTDNSGISANNQIIIPTNPEYTYNYDVDCNNDGVYESTGVIGNYTCNYETPETYQVAIKGEFPSIYFNHQGDTHKILSINQWGSVKWKSMAAAFMGCSNLTLTTTDSPDLSNVTNMSYMFGHATSFNSDISNWNVSNVTNMAWMFWGATSFNGDISSWDVSNVTDMARMFYEATSFNGDISSWDVSNVTDMSVMFTDAISFNSDISNWDVSNVTDMSFMFSGATSFNGDISSWDVSNVTDMSSMFKDATSFNSDLSNWDVSNVTDMSVMFSGAISFNKNLSSWNVDNVNFCLEVYFNTPLWTLPKPNFTSCEP